MLTMPAPSDPAEQSRILVIVPTYNEIENLAATVSAVRSAVPEADVLVVDDDSPDRTGELAERLAKSDTHVHVMHRSVKDGLGQAYLAGFAWSAERGYQTIVEMDADGSHPAAALPSMLAVLRSDPRIGLVIGSRWITGGSVVDWPLRRRLLSVGANRYARLALRLAVHDITAGYRAYRAIALASLDMAHVNSRGYCFQIDLTIRTVDAGWLIAEVPIAFRERVAGVSKMSGDIVFEAMRRVTWWGLVRRWSARAPR